MGKVDMPSALAMEAKSYLLEKFDIEYEKYDVIKGYRADDSYFSFAQDFLNGTISYRQLNRAMHLGKHGQQYVLKSKKAFEQIHYVQALYSPYHEMDIRHFVEKMNEMYRKANPDTNLKMRRQKAGLSQKQLAEMAGIPLRTIQQYEQRQKNINHAKVEYLLQLSNTLCCEVECLIERVGAYEN